MPARRLRRRGGAVVAAAVVAGASAPAAASSPLPPPSPSSTSSPSLSLSLSLEEEGVEASSGNPPGPPAARAASAAASAASSPNSTTPQATSMATCGAPSSTASTSKVEGGAPAATAAARASLAAARLGRKAAARASSGEFRGGAVGGKGPRALRTSAAMRRSVCEWKMERRLMMRKNARAGQWRVRRESNCRRWRADHNPHLTYGRRFCLRFQEFPGWGGRGGAGRHRVLRDARKSIKKERRPSSASLEWTQPLTTFSLLFRRVLSAEPRSTFSGPRLDNHQQSHAAPGPL